MTVSSEIVSALAQMAHECNRAYCATLGDTSQVRWEVAPTWQKESAVAGVEGVIAGNGPEDSHRSWLLQKANDGWKYGPVKDELLKTHPCFLPYEELPEAQKQKDHLFVAVVKAGLAALEVGLADSRSTAVSASED